MRKKRFYRNFGTITLSSMMVFGMLPQNVISVFAEEGIATYANTSQSTYISKIASIDDIQVSDNIVDITTTAGEQIKITFMSDTMFRFNLEPNGDFVEEPSTNNSKYTAKMLEKTVSDYEGVTPSVSEDETYYMIQTDKVALYISKVDSTMKMINLETGTEEWSEKEPLQYGGGKTIQTLNTSEDEYFYGGGMQNGYFSHKNKKINIFDKADSGNWGDGMTASPAPFYMSTNGYGVMRYTWATGQYDFDSNLENTVKTMHNENRFDAIYFSGDSLNDALNQYTEITGRPVLMPEYAYYLGHANCYNRDYWREDPNGRYEFNGKRYTEVGATDPKDGSLIETLNGENGGVSARGVLDRYQEHDMPLGWFLPNDGYGCGYGQDDTDTTPDTADAEAVDINIKNLKDFSDYANARGVEVGLWTQSDLVPTLKDGEGKVIAPHLRRDFQKEVENGGVRAIKTDVAWVGQGGAMALNSVMTGADTISNTTNYRPFVVSLFGWNGTQRYASIWSGDQTGGLWEYIRFHIPSYIGLGLSGNPNVGSDMDGIYGGNHPDIQTRDYQWKAFTPVEIDMDGWGSSVKNPATFGGQYEAINRMYLKLKAQMLPYYYSAAYEANQTGLPTLRAMVLEYPNDTYARTTATQYQYMWGDNLLVAPIYQNTAADEIGNDIRNNIYLPDENQVWIDYFTGDQYKGGAVLNSFDSPIWKLPVFVKNGAIIPMTEENNSPSEIATDAMRTFDVYPSGDTSYSLFEDDGYSNDFEKGKYATTEITSSAPKTGEGTATITVNKAITGANQSYTQATGNDAQRATEFKVHVQKAPSNVSLSIGGNDTTLTKAATLEEYLNSNGNVYFYDEAPLVETYTDSESISEDDSKLTMSPILYVKTAKTDISANAVQIVVEGFNNTKASGEDGKSEAPATPTNLTSNEEVNTDESISLSWDAVTGDTNGATSYDLRIGGENGIVFSNILTNSYVHEDLLQNTEYTYEVRAVNSVGASAWSAPYTIATKLDPWRNVPENMSIELNQPSAWGVENLINRNKTDNWFSDYSDAALMAENKVITLNLGASYNMDKLELYGIPYESNNRDYDSKRPRNINLEISNDGQNWKKLYENLDVTYEDQLATIDMEGTTTQYIRITANEPKNNYIAFAEIVPYKVEGSKPHATGDVNGDGIADDGDLTFMQNYIGIHDTSTTWVQVSHADYNFNGMIDGYDLAFVNAWSTIHYSETKKSLEGTIVALPSKTEIKAGEEITVDIYGVDMNDVDGFSFELEDANAKFDIIAQAEPSAEVSNMLFYPGKDNARIMAAAVNTNAGRGVPMNGTKLLASAKLKARVDTTFDMNITNAIIVNTQYIAKQANPEYVKDDADFPTIVQGDGRLVAGEDFTYSSTTMDKFQGTDHLGYAFDDNKETVSELKWGAGAEMPLNYTMTLKEVKEIETINIHKRTTSNGILKTMEVIGYLNGKEVYREKLDSPKEEPVLTFNVPEGTKMDKIELNALDSHQATDSTKYLTIREIEVYGKGDGKVTGITLGDNTINSLKFGASAVFTANVEPNSALNPYYTVTSSDPSVSVQRVQNENGALAYLLTAAPTTDGKSKTVTITATSKEGNMSVSQDVLLYADNKLIPHAGMKATASSSSKNEGTNGAPEMVLDDNKNTYWHSIWEVTPHSLPQWLQIELPEAHVINMIDFTPRINAANGYIMEYEVQVSMTGDDNDFKTVAHGTLPKSNATKVIAFDPVNAKFVRLIALKANDTGNDANVAAVSEMNVYGLLPTVNATIGKTELNAGESTQISVELLPKEFFDGKAITYQSSDEAVLKVEANGNITTTDQGGKAAVIVSAEGMGEVASYTFFVKANTEALDDAIADLVNLKETDFTPNSWLAFQNVVTKANAMLAKKDLSKAEIAAMVEELTKAIDNVLLPAANTSSLDEAITSAKAAIEGEKANSYTVGSVKALQQAIAKAEEVKADKNATQEAVNEQIALVASAYQGLTNISVLNSAVTFAEAIDRDAYLDDSLAVLDQAVTAAKAILANETATQTEVAKATDDITTAVKGLEAVGNKQALYQKLGVAKAYNPDHFTTASYAILADAIKHADTIANGKYAQKDIDAAVAALQSAIDGLKEKPSKAQLEIMLALANEVDPNAYTETSYKALKDAIAAATLVYNNEDATKDEISKVVLDLQNAMNNLQEVGKTDPVDPTPEDPNKPQPNPTPGQNGNSGSTGTQPGTSTTPTAPSTGDTTNASGWMLFLLASAGSIVALKKVKTRKEEN